MQATIITYSATISACEKAGKWREAHRAPRLQESRPAEMPWDALTKHRFGASL